VRRNGSVFLLAGFDILQTNWPFEPSFVLFCYNAANFLGMQVGRKQELNLEVGQPIIVEGLKPEISARINGPDFSGMEIKSNSSGSIRFPGTSRVGVYNLSVPAAAISNLKFQISNLFAVNLLDTQESNIEPLREIVFAGQPVEAQERALSRANLPLWPFLVGLALVLACLEWLIYNLKVRI